MFKLVAIDQLDRWLALDMNEVQWVV